MLADQRFQLGVRLFNQGEFFACHEIWEELWHELRGRDHDCLQGLIQVAVAYHHLQRRNLRGAQYLSTRAALRLARCGPVFASIQVPRLCERLARDIAAAGRRGHVSCSAPRLPQTMT